MLKPLLRALVANRLFLCGGGIVVLLAMLALAAPVLSHAHLLRPPFEQDQKALDADGMPLGPNRNYPLGTDNLGRDILARVVHGARVSLTVGTAAMLIATVMGVIVGVLAGYFGGKLDMGLMRFTEMMMTIPPILLAIALAGLMDGKVIHLHPASLNWHFLDIQLQRGMVSLFLVIGFVAWPGMVRVIRGQVLALKEREFIQASRVLGASNRRVIFRHIMPNLLPIIIVLAAMSTANTILLEAGLGYLGIGVPPPAPSWGAMISDGQAYFVLSPHMVIVPGIAICLTVLAFNLLGQGLQDVLDVHQKR
jgi:ABC-type dipeptide/oligopeptide/nickel transport system permease subunit